MIYLICGLALLLRLININQSLWWDEAINVLAVKNSSFIQMLTSYPLTDFHPPIYFGILWLWTRIFGISEIAARSPSIIFGVLTIFITYLIGKEVFSKWVGLVAALILAINPLHIFYSQEARMYSLAGWAVAFYFWSLIGLIKSKKRSSIYLIIGLILIVYSDYVAYLAIPGGLIWVYFYHRKTLKRVLTLSFIAFLFYIPWLFVFPKQLENGKLAAEIIPGWAKVVGSTSIKDLILVFVKSVVGKFTLDNKFLYALSLIPAFLIYSFSVFQALKSKDKFIYLILLWFFIPIIVAYAVSFYIPILSYFRLIFILPALMLIISFGILKTKSVWLRNFLLAGIVIINLFFSICYFINPKFQREDWRGMVKSMQSLSGGFLVLFEDVNLPAPFVYYDNHDFPTMAALKNFPANTEADLLDLSKINTNKIYLVEYLVDISDPNRLVQKKLDQLGFKRVDVEDFPGVGLVYEYSREF